MADLPMITPELVAQLAHGTYRRQLDSDRDREKFDALPESTQRSRTAGYHKVVRNVLQELGFPEPERAKAAPSTEGGR